MRTFIWRLLTALAVVAAVFAAPAAAMPVHGIAMHGEPALGPDYTHFPYANPQAPRGGVYHEAVIGSFDSLNPFIIKGQAAAALRTFVFESLMARNLSEPFSLYGLIAKSVEMTPERDAITFHLDERAKFSDGTPITAEDILFSWRTLRDQGRPNHRSYYKKVLEAKALDERTVYFKLDGSDRELPLILGLMPVLSKAYFTAHAFDETTLKPIVSSGPYVIASVKPGEQLILKRNPDYWGNDVPANRGLWNFDELRFDYFRDNQAAFEAFKKGLADVRVESDPTRWSTGYDINPVAGSKVIQEVVPQAIPAPVSAFVMNTRRPALADIRTRQALIYAFDFEWANINLFHGLFERTQGYFDGSPLSSVGVAADAHERALLEKVGAKLPWDIVEGEYRMPVSDGSGRDRGNLRKAYLLLKEAGWVRRGSQLVDPRSGAPFEIEIVVKDREHERIALNYKRTLAQIGITLEIRQIDSAQFQRRLQTYDFDLIPFTWYNSLSPGNEQSFYWGSYGRDHDGTRNYMGAHDPAIDKLIEAMLAARGDDDFRDSVRALDRVLIAGAYIVPLYHAPGQWLARWDRIRYPETASLYGFRLEAAWFENR